MSTRSSATHALSRGHVPGFGIAGFIGRIAKAVATQYRINRDVNQLRALSDQTLKDIGIHRSEISSLVRQMESRQFERRHAHR